MSLGFLSFNRNKRSVVLDITKPSGHDLAYSLLMWADVLVINMRVDTRQRRGFTYEDLAAINPRLIYASMTAYGERGPDADLPGYDVTVQARAGDMESRRVLGSPPPPQTSLFHFDMATAMLTFCAVMLALRERERTGRGQKIEGSILQSALTSHAIQLTRVDGRDESYPVRATGLPAQYLCSDGKYLYAPAAGPRWEPFCRSMGLEHLLEDPRFDTVEKRQQKVEVLTEVLSHHFSAKPAAEWEAILKATSFPVSIVNEMSDLYDDPQVIANEMITEFEQPGLGTVKAVGMPFRMSGTADEPWLTRHAPTLGEHTYEVLQELGHSANEIEAFKAEGILG